MPATRLNFKHIRENADFEKVLSAYGIELQKDGNRPGQFKCLCPFHDDHKPSMKVNIEKNIFNCFVCDDGHGNVLDFVMKMDGSDIRAAAKAVAEISGIAFISIGRPTKPKRQKAKSENASTSNPDKALEESGALKDKELDATSCNKVLTFELKNLVTEHPFFEQRGLTREMIERFGLGIATRGIMKNRLVFPIHDSEGELVAYCGRFVGDERPEDEPKYKLPPNFRKELELFNWHRVKERVRDKPVILVESFFSVVRIYPDYPVVSPMGRSLSAQQLELLKTSGVSSVIILFDGDDPGRAAVTSVGRQLLFEGFEVTAPVVSEDFKPHRCREGVIEGLVNC